MARPLGTSGTLLLLTALIGVPVGVGLFTVTYAKGLSYLSNDPAACVNCHIMTDQYQSWSKGPHHATATCNGCHVPAGFPAKYIAKGLNGYHHSLGFTMQPSNPDDAGVVPFFREPIQIKPGNSQILQDNCLRCHGELVHEIVRGSAWDQDAIRCVHCHRGVGHGAMR